MEDDDAGRVDIRYVDLPTQLPAGREPERTAAVMRAHRRWVPYWGFNFSPLGAHQLWGLDVGGAGQCAFLSVAEGLTSLAVDGRIGDSTLSLKVRAQRLREMVVDHIKGDATMLRLAAITHQMGGRRDYIQKMKRRTTFADSPEISAMSTMFNVAFIVFNANPVTGHVHSMSCVGMDEGKTHAMLLVRPGLHYQLGGLQFQMGAGSMRYSLIPREHPLYKLLAEKVCRRYVRTPPAAAAGAAAATGRSLSATPPDVASGRGMSDGSDGSDIEMVGEGNAEFAPLPGTPAWDRAFGGAQSDDPSAWPSPGSWTMPESWRSWYPWYGGQMPRRRATPRARHRRATPRRHHI